MRTLGRTGAKSVLIGRVRSGRGLEAAKGVGADGLMVGDEEARWKHIQSGVMIPKPRFCISMRVIVALGHRQSQSGLPRYS